MNNELIDKILTNQEGDFSELEMDLAGEIRLLQKHLAQALRQWKMYADYEGYDIETANNMEAKFYQDAKKMIN